MRLIMIVAMLAALLFIPGVSAYTITGDVITEDNAKATISAWPHTTTLPEQTVYVNITSKIYEGKIDVYYGFNTSNALPKTGDYKKNGEWLDVSSNFDSVTKEYQGFDKWYYYQGFNVTAGVTYETRMSLKINQPGDGKYWVCIKPSYVTLQYAINNNLFMCLDPWWNTNYTTRYNVTPINQVTSPFLANDTYGLDAGSGPQFVWCNSSTLVYAYHNPTDDSFMCANDTTQYRTFIDQGNGSNYGNTDSRIVRWYPLDDLNEMESGPTCVPASAPFANSSGQIGDAYDFDGSDDGLNCSPITELVNHNQFALTAWIQPRTMSTARFIELYSTNDDGLTIRGDGTNNFHYYWGTSDGAGSESDGSIAITAKTWYFVAVTWDGANFYAYVDGVQDWTAAEGGTLADFTVSNPDLWLGRHRAGSDHSNALIDNVMVYNESLSVAEIHAIYNNTKPDGYSSASSPEALGFVTVSPTNTTYYGLPFPILYSPVVTCNQSWYELNGGSRVYMDCLNTTALASIGSNKITIYMNESDGSEHTETISFTMNNDNLGTCDSDYTNEALYFYFNDEIELKTTRGSAEFTIANGTYQFNSSADNETNFTICTPNSNTYTVDMTMIFWNESVGQRTYYFYQADIDSDNPTNITLYLYDGDEVKIETRDANDRGDSDVYVNIQRYYVSENTYRTIAIGLSDSTGAFLTYAALDTVFYRFTLSEAGTAISTEGPQVIIDTTDDPESIIFYTAPAETEFFDIRNNVASSCYVNYVTNNTICSVTDSTGLIVSADLYVEEMVLSGNEDVCSDSGSGSAFTLACNLGANPDGTYKYVLTITPTSGNPYVLATDTFMYTSSNIYGDFGVFASFIIMITLVIVGLVAAPIAMILGVIALGVSAYMGFIEISITSIVGLAVVAIIIMYKGGDR